MQKKFIGIKKIFIFIHSDNKKENTLERQKNFILEL